MATEKKLGKKAMWLIWLEQWETRMKGQNAHYEDTSLADRDDYIFFSNPG